MIKGEMGALKKKQAEEERRKQMAEGLAKFQAILAQAAAEREAAFNANEEAKAKIAFIKGEEAAADGAAKYLDEHTAYINGERNTLKSTLANSKATLTKTKDDLIKELAAAKDTYASATE